MVALTSDRDTPMRTGTALELGVASGKKIYAGSIVAVNTTTGYAEPGATSTTLRGIGRAEEQVDNTNGADGAVTVRISKGIFKFANDATDPVSDADIGNTCYIVDDQTVAKTDGTGTRSPAGTVFQVDSDGVWVRFD